MTTAHTDINQRHWCYRISPSVIHPYLRLMRVDRPIGVWLLLLPCWWGMTLACSGVPNLRYMALFAMGSFLMRSAGCVYNDLVDKGLDGAVKRTANRPLPAGEVTQVQAILFLGMLLLFSLLVLLCFSKTTIFLGCLSLGLVFTYPWMKRITYWPQAFLGLTFNWGALMGWCAVRDTIELPALLLYAAGIAWTLIYDTIYAHQDKSDDLMAGVKSTALRLGPLTRPFLWGWLAVMSLCLGYIGHVLKVTPFYYVSVLSALGYLAYLIKNAGFDDPGQCLQVFKRNRFVGWLILIGCILQ